MNKNTSKTIRIGLAATIITLGIMSLAYADIYINVVAVNGADAPKTSSLKFDLPGELSAEDILDASGLQVDYNVEDANYFVYGDISLKPKESKTFRIHVKDKWTVTPDQVAQIKKEIDQGYEALGKPHDLTKADILKTRLDNKIDYIVNLQSTNADSVDKRIDAYRAYVKELKRIQNSALDVDYWRSDPGKQEQPKLIHLSIDVKNPTNKPQPSFKIKQY